MILFKNKFKKLSILSLSKKWNYFKIRLSQIYYIESLRHQIIIHSINGEMIERKTLSQFIKEIQSLDFIQIHKSYIINKRFIQEIKNQEVILKEQTHLPIGRSYKESLKEQN